MAIAIITSGGDSSGMNPGIKRFIEYTHELGLKSYLIYNGLEGMIDDEIKEADIADASGIIFRGGTIIGTSRSKRFFEYEYRKKAYENLKKRDISKVIVLGGDGSFKAFDVFSKDFDDITFIGVPTTIDNDIALTEYCLGVDTALNVIRRSCDEIRDTALSFKRAFIIETMGRHCGYLALVSALTSGAEICLIQEIKYDLDSIKKRLQQEFKEGRKYLLAIVSEGMEMADELKEWIEKELHIESRVTILGHIQRGGNPTVFDRLMAYEFVTHALSTDLKNRVVVFNDSKFEYKTFDEINNCCYQLKPSLLKLGKRLSR